MSNTLQRYKVLVVVVVVLLVVVAVVMAIRESKPVPPPPKPLSGQSFYSADDGKTFFTDSAQKIPPFDRDGQVAVRAYVFTCDGGKSSFVGYLERYTPEGRKQMEEVLAKQDPNPMATLSNATAAAAEIKKPGDADWISKSDIEKCVAITDVKCPHDGRHPVEQVMP